MTDGFVALSQSGANYNGDIVKTASQINGLGLTMNAFTQIVQQNAAGLAAYGGSVTNGAKQFTELTEVMRNQYGGELYSLGLRYEEQAEQLAKYTAVQSRNTVFGTLSYKEQSAAFKEYITDLNELASITGKSRQQLAEEMAQNNLRADANLRLQGATEEAQKMMTMAFKMGGEGSPLSNIMMAGAAGRSLAQEIAAGTPGIREFVAANPEAAEKLRTLADQMSRGEIDQKGFLAGLKSLGPGIENSAQELRGLYGISDIATVSVQAASDLQQFMNQIGKTGTAVDHVSKKANGAGGQFMLAEAALAEVAGTIKEEVQNAIAKGVDKLGLKDVDVGASIQKVISGLDEFATELRIFASDPLDYIMGGMSTSGLKENLYKSHGGEEALLGKLQESNPSMTMDSMKSAINQMSDDDLRAMTNSARSGSNETINNVFQSANKNSSSSIVEELEGNAEKDFSALGGNVYGDNIPDIIESLKAGKGGKIYISGGMGGMGTTVSGAASIMADLQKLMAVDKAKAEMYIGQIRQALGKTGDEWNWSKDDTGEGLFNLASPNYKFWQSWQNQAGSDRFSSIPKLQYGGMTGLGMPHIVGERGAELFTPSSAGTITPNNELATAKDSMAIAAKLDQLNSTMKLVASNTNSAGQTEAMNAQISTLKSLLGEAKRTYRVSRDLRDSNYS